MQNFILMIVERFGYLGVVFLIALENVFPPLPSEFILLFAGFATSKTSLNFFAMLIFATLGSLIGAMILYFIGSILDKERIKKIINTRIGKVLRIDYKDIDRADEWFNKKGIKAVFICRFIPLIRSLISIPAGMSKISKFKFISVTVLGALIWNGSLILMGNKLGDNWEDVNIVFEKYSVIILLILFIFMLIGISLYCYKRYKNKDLL